MLSLRTARPVHVAGPSARRSVAVRFVDPNSVDALVKKDHDEVRRMYQEFKRATTAEKKQEWGYRMTRELSIHSSKEEETVYPVIAKTLGEESRKHLLNDHAQMKKLLSKLEGMSAERDLKAYEDMVHQIFTEFSTHAKEEEDKEMPRLINSTGVDAIELGRQFQAASDHAVTRPHPWAPDKEPINQVTNRLTRPLDDAQDAIRFGGPAPHPPPGDKNDPSKPL